MCDVCGCSDGAQATISASASGAGGAHEHVLQDGTVLRHSHGHTETLAIRVLEKNDGLAHRNRAWFQEHQVVALNLMSSPGSGKTSLLERTLREAGLPASVLEGDQATGRDADRIRATGTPVVQINTGQGCHLEADMVWRGIELLQLRPRSVLFIENVGNLVCPALFDLGEAARVVLFSVTEGEDKPLKYPYMFRAADLVLFTKLDLLPHLDFDLDRAREAVSAVAPGAPTLAISARTGAGLAAWYDWLAWDRWYAGGHAHR